MNVIFGIELRDQMWAQKEFDFSLMGTTLHWLMIQHIGSDLDKSALLFRFSILISKMEVKAARKVSIFRQVGGNTLRNEVCTYWRAGRCNRNPCRFMHRESPPPQSQKSQARPQGGNHQKQSRNMTLKNPHYCAPKIEDEGRVNRSIESMTNKVQPINGGRKHEHMDQEIADASIGEDSTTHPQPEVHVSAAARPEMDKSSLTQPKQCKYWLTNNCVHGDKCKDLHSWSYGSGFTMLSKLKGHSKAISGICLPSGHDKLYSGCKDSSVRAWDCRSGQCAGLVNIDGEVGCLITEGPWLFAGLHNAVKAWNLQRDAEFTLNGTGGLVCIMATDDDKLFAGTEDGSILVWKWQQGANIPEPASMLKGHNGAVCSLVVGGKKRLYSGSRDCTIKVWDLQHLQCLQTLYGHTGDVTSVVCWDSYLLSASLDSTLKVWAETGSGQTIETVYQIKDDHGINALCGIHDAEAKPILLCSYTDQSVRLYDLPSFVERGRIFSKCQVQVIQIGVDGLFFTGDATGEISVWKLL